MILSNGAVVAALPSLLNAQSPESPQNTVVVHLDHNVMRRARSIVMKNNVTAADSFKATIAKHLRPAQIAVAFNNEFTTVTLTGPPTLDFTAATTFVNDKYARLFKPHIEKRSSTYCFPIATIWAALDVGIDLAVQIQDIAVTVDVSIAYQPNGTDVDLFFKPEETEDQINLLRSLFEAQCKALERDIDRAKTEKMDKEKRETAGAQSRDEEHIAVEAEVVLEQVTVKEYGVQMSTTLAQEHAQEDLAAPAEIPTHLASEPLASDQQQTAPHLEQEAAAKEDDEQETNVNEETTQVDLEPSKQPYPVRTEARSPASSSSYNTADEKDDETGAPPTFALVFLKDRTTQLIQMNQDLEQELLMHLDRIANAYNLHVLFSRRHGGVQMKASSAKDLATAQEELQTFLNQDSMKSALAQKETTPDFAILKSGSDRAIARELISLDLDLLKSLVDCYSDSLGSVDSDGDTDSDPMYSREPTPAAAPRQPTPQGAEPHEQIAQAAEGKSVSINDSMLTNIVADLVAEAGQSDDFEDQLSADMARLLAIGRGM